MCPQEVSALGKLTPHIGASIVDAALADEMPVRAGSPVFHSRVLHLENDEPVQLEERWVDPAIAPEYGLQDFANTTPSQYRVRVAPSQRVEYRVEAATPGADARAARDGRERALYRAPSAYVVERASRVYRNPVAPRPPFPILREFLSGSLCTIASARRVSVIDLHSLSSIRFVHFVFAGSR
jgi:hypothetical protein